MKKKKILIIVTVVAAIAAITPSLIGYFIQGPTQDQGDTALGFTPIALEHKQVMDLKKSLPFVGSAPIDIDGDGVDEIFFGGGNNQQDRFFKYNNKALLDIGNLGLTKADGITTYGVAVIDVTHDGKKDIFVAREDGLYLYTNTGGQFTGEKVSFPLNENSVPLSIAMADINKDGAVDLYISNYIREEFVEGETIFNKPYGGYSNLLLNNGDNTFSDITKSSGLFQQHNTFTSVFVDLNNDLNVDLVIAHDTGHVRIYKNNADNTFTEQKNPSVFSYPMGIAVSDINNDGLMDLYFSNVGKTLPKFLVKGDLREDQKFNMNYMLFENQGDFVFKDVAVEKNAAHYGFGWGVVSYDFNNDTRADYLISENYARFPGVKYLSLYPGNLLQQYKDGGFKPVEKKAKVENPYFGISPIVTDFNQDGWPDVFFSNIDSPVLAFLNQPIAGRNWLKVEFPDQAKYIGTLLTLTTASGKKLYNQFYTNEGLSSDQTHIVYFGLGVESKIASLEVRYPDGRSQTVSNPKANHLMKLQ
jgi:hypothetical protein